jgi:hypothetical protein
MADEELTYWDYVKEAFHLKPRLPGLGAIPVNKLALLGFGVLGLVVSPGFWFLGLAAELGYLGLLAGNERFQRVIRAYRAQRATADWDARIRAQLRKLSPQSANRYRKLARNAAKILELSRTHLESRDVAGFDDLRNSSLHQLLWIFLRLLITHDTMQKNLRNVDRKLLERKIASLQRRIGKLDEGGSLRKSLMETLKIQERRLENLQKAEENLEIVRAELHRIEQQVELIREEVVVNRDPEILSSRLDAVTGTLTETSRWMEDHADFLDTLAEDEFDLDIGTPPPMPGLTE